MTGLETTILGQREFLNSLLHMEENYPGMIRRAFYDKAVDFCLFGFPVVNSPTHFPYGPYNRLNQYLTERRVKKLVRSFRKRAINLEPNKEQYVDKVAKKLGIGVPKEIKPQRDFSNVPAIIRDADCMQLVFKESDQVGFRYMRTHGY